jgi:hypothetical protein
VLPGAPVECESPRAIELRTKCLLDANSVLQRRYHGFSRQTSGSADLFFRTRVLFGNREISTSSAQAAPLFQHEFNQSWPRPFERVCGFVKTLKDGQKSGIGCSQSHNCAKERIAISSGLADGGAHPLTAVRASCNLVVAFLSRWLKLLNSRSGSGKCAFAPNSRSYCE